MSYYRRRRDEPETEEEQRARSRRLEAMTLTNPARDVPDLGINTQDRNEETDYDEMMADYIKAYGRRR